MSTEKPRAEAPLKQHGDKLSGALGTPRKVADEGGAQPAEESLKVHGDKLQSSVDKAVGNDGRR